MFTHSLENNTFFESKYKDFFFYLDNTFYKSESASAHRADLNGALKKYKLLPSKVCMIGDHTHKDAKGAKFQGIDEYHISEPELTSFKLTSHLLYFKN